MTTTELARRPTSAVAIPSQVPQPVEYRLVNPWRKAVFAAGGLSAVTLPAAAVTSRIDLDLLPHATGVCMGSLGLLLAATGMHSRYFNRVRSRDKFVAIKP